MTSVVVLASAKASGHLENACLHVKIYRAPDDRPGLSVGRKQTYYAIVGPAPIVAGIT